MPLPNGGTPYADLVLDPKVSKLLCQMARKFAASPGVGAPDPEDVRQELTLQLIRKFARFDPKLSSPATFANRVLANRIRSMVRDARAQKRAFGRGACSLNSKAGEKGALEIGDTLDESVGRRHTGQRQRSHEELTQLKVDVADAKALLTPDAKEAAAVLSHVPKSVAADVLGKSRRQIANCVEEMRALFLARGVDA